MAMVIAFTVAKMVGEPDVAVDACATGRVTQMDGGYLTGLGRDAAEHAQAALTILTSVQVAIKE